MSIRKEDRHGLANLEHERTKPLDKYHFPPWLLFAMVGIPVFMVLAQLWANQDGSIEELHQRNLLLAMKKTQEKVIYGEDEITGGEELTMASTQYKEVVE